MHVLENRNSGVKSEVFCVGTLRDCYRSMMGDFETADLIIVLGSEEIFLHKVGEQNIAKVIFERSYTVWIYPRISKLREFRECW